MTLIEAIERARAEAIRLKTSFVIYRWQQGYGFRLLSTEGANGTGKIVVGHGCTARYTVDATGKAEKVAADPRFTIESCEPAVRGVRDYWKQVHDDDGHAICFTTKAGAQRHIDTKLYKQLRFRVVPYEPLHHCLRCGEIPTVAQVRATVLATDASQQQ